MDVNTPDPEEICWLRVTKPLPSDLVYCIKTMWPIVKQHSPESHDERRELRAILKDSRELLYVQVWVDKRLDAKRLVAKRLASENLVGMKLVGFCLTEICNVEQLHL